MDRLEDRLLSLRLRVLIVRANLDLHMAQPDDLSLLETAIEHLARVQDELNALARDVPFPLGEWAGEPMTKKRARVRKDVVAAPRTDPGPN